MNKYKKIKLKTGETIDEHRLIMGVNGFNTVIHHKDGDKGNNNPENLEVMTRSEHCKIHGFGIKIRPAKLFEPDEKGNAVCRLCGKVKPWDEFMTASSWSHGKSSRCKTCYNSLRKIRRHELRKIAGAK